MSTDIDPETDPAARAATPADDAAPEILKEFHIFISYRVRTDAALAERLCDKLQLLDLTRESGESSAIRIKCFFDKQNLTIGEGYENQFLSSLQASCLFMPLISEECLKPVSKMGEGSKDNVLLEWETALRLHGDKKIEIIPLLIGSNATDVSGGRVYHRFNGFTIPMPSVHSATNPTSTIADTIKRIFGIQGIFLDPEDFSDKLGVINSRLSKDIWPRFRSQWKDLEALGAEPIFGCVQCGKDYKVSENADGSCRFHPYPPGYRGYSCCDEKDPNKGCLRGKHRNKHHNDYAYERFSNWLIGIVNNTAMSELLTEISCDDWERGVGDACWMSVGRVIGYDNPEYGKIYVRARINDGHNGRMFFNTFSPSDLEGFDLRSPITALDVKGGYIAKATWIIENEDIVGIEMTCQTPSASTPAVAQMRFKWPENDSDGGPIMIDQTVVSKPHFGEQKSSGQRQLPDNLTKGPVMHLPVPRAAEKFNSWSDRSPLRIKVSKTYQTHDNYRNCDYYGCEVLNFVNPTDKQIGILEVTAFWRVRDTNIDPQLIFGEGTTESLDTWRQVPAEGIYSEHIPSPVPAQSTLGVKVSARIPTPSGSDKASYEWRNIGFLIRHSPILVDFVFEDLDGNKCGITVEYVCPKMPFVDRISSDTMSFFPVFDMVEWSVDHIELMHTDVYRKTISEIESGASEITYPGGDDVIFSIKFRNICYQFRTPTLRSYVLRAIKEGNNVISVIQEGQAELFAMVDTETRTVYAFRITAESNTNSNVFYFPIADYGDALLADAPIADRSGWAAPNIDGEYLERGYFVVQGEKGIVYENKPQTSFEPRFKPEPQPAAGASAGPAAAIAGFLSDPLAQAAVAEIVKREVQEQLSGFEAKQNSLINERFDRIEALLARSQNESAAAIAAATAAADSATAAAVAATTAANNSEVSRGAAAAAAATTVTVVPAELSEQHLHVVDQIQSVVVLELLNHKTIIEERLNQFLNDITKRISGPGGSGGDQSAPPSRPPSGGGIASWLWKPNP
ncbi:uncharacterized protein BJ171DRAFT_564217 [Polychytrium aggregatum]|uniref:uncharacterized protein n=1 Tax=Polychytrium aggregatum TaxID=110093 RepID=UPI0022FF0E24|nr:uncharacterized protein BJ171DRAFT_564217 [Polychytrium aggregatum]KAI9209686.1 hypothetical protein BJ171DRAFT_564217 [Polychytrium aggregatum]